MIKIKNTKTARFENPAQQRVIRRAILIINYDLTGIC